MFDILQLTGGLILAIGYIPQIRQLVKTRSCKDLNLKTFILLSIGIGLMEVYAINLEVHGTGLMFLITNSLSLAIVLCISVLILKYSRTVKEKEANIELWARVGMTIKVTEDELQALNKGDLECYTLVHSIISNTTRSRIDGETYFPNAGEPDSVNERYDGPDFTFE